MNVVERETTLKLTSAGQQNNLTASGIFLFGNSLIGPFEGGANLFYKLIPDAPFSVGRPHVIQVQARQFENNDFKWPDQFSIMVNETSRDFIRIQIARTDTLQKGAGWGQNLMVDIFVVDNGVEPLVTPEG